ncbi:hypothetical protein [Cryobacterium sp. MLB-32]|uniref:hypothetical protein n=1 Tax=Cryobacterium sp. MLB-32 TaxID=1529318 RepID=UPI0012E0AAFA|nr:hypothetical protein [Cryobacterium sp. MLB-32]
MDTQTLATVTAIGSVFAAVGTVGALFAALMTLRYESVERRRSEVKGVRAVLNWGEPQWVMFKRMEDPNFDPIAYREEERAAAAARGEDASKIIETASPLGSLENGTDETIYDVKVALRPIKFFRMSLGGSRARLEPGEKYDLPPGPEMEERTAFWDPAGLKPGVEAVFTDARGTRWNRTTLGRLVQLKPLRWFAPWRIPHELEREDLPWWAGRAHWHYRWADHSYRDIERYPPVWWAVDIRWSRWRYARKNDPVAIPLWQLRKRYKNRHSIAASRFGARLPLPWWAIDDRWRGWRWYRNSVASDRAQRNSYKASLPDAH